MGLFDFIKKQLIDIIEWPEQPEGVLVYRFPMQDQEIQTGARLTVRESQAALFVNQGKIADRFAPGLYRLGTDNLPVLTDLNNWTKGFKSPFKSDVYFFSTRDQIDQKWGTPTPISLRDKEYGVIRLRSYGVYSYKIDDVKLFYTKISGNRDLYTTADVSGQLLSLIVTSLADYFGKSEVAFIDMAANQSRFSDKLKEVLTGPFREYGLQLQSFFVQNISLPEELQQRFDKLAAMNMLGDLQKYTKFEAAESIPLAASNEGGLAGTGAGIGAGISIGQQMAAAMASASQGGTEGQTAQDAAAALEKIHDLYKKGILTQAEYDAKKAELLQKIR